MSNKVLKPKKASLYQFTQKYSTILITALNSSNP